MLHILEVYTAYMCGNRCIHAKDLNAIQLLKKNGAGLCVLAQEIPQDKTEEPLICENLRIYVDMWGCMSVYVCVCVFDMQT